MKRSSWVFFTYPSSVVEEKRWRIEQRCKLNDVKLAFSEVRAIMSSANVIFVRQ